MPVKVKETTERWCCEPQDLRPYFGLGSDLKLDLSFCVRCGQLYREKTCIDAAGGRGTQLVEIDPTQGEQTCAV